MKWAGGCSCWAPSPAWLKRRAAACWTNTPFRTVYSESDGLVNFVWLDTGSYAVREPSARTGYLTISNVLYVFDVDASNSTVTGPVRMGGSDVNNMYAENGTLYLKNFRHTKKIYLYKYWQNEVSGYVYRPEKITVDLYRNGELYMEDLELTKDDRYNNTTWRLILEDLMLYLHLYRGSCGRLCAVQPEPAQQQQLQRKRLPVQQAAGRAADRQDRGGWR